MSERDGYQPGVPCWVDTWQPDADRAIGFYTQLLGWEAHETPSPGPGQRHFMCTLRDRAVAAIGSPVPEGVPVAWGTYVWVDSADDTAARAAGASTAAGLRSSPTRPAPCSASGSRASTPARSS
jgi:uncharacterized protein